MDYTLIFNEKKYVIQIDDINDNQLRLSIDGKMVSLTSHRLSPNHMQLIIDNGKLTNNVSAYVSKQDDGKLIQINGHVYHIQDEDILAKQTSKKKSGGGFTKQYYSTHASSSY